MLVGIVADLHSNLEATETVFARLDALSVDRILCLGDITGYNANPNEVVEMVRDREIPTLMGNHDAAVCGLEDPWFFNSKAKLAVEWHLEQLAEDHKRWLAKAPEQITFGGECVAVHGAPSNRDEYILDWLDAMRQCEFLSEIGARICFFGHSHRASLFYERGSQTQTPTEEQYNLKAPGHYFINPGSVGQPRDDDPRAAFGLFDTDECTFEFHRVEYDIDKTAQKVMDAGLPAVLAKRLFIGK
jgi:diadenosine tetraphosphatase ApaH/serine/threonine PP2A family protein phosphatase